MKVSKVLVLNPNTGLITMGEGETLLDRLVINVIMKNMKIMMMMMTAIPMLLTSLILIEQADSYFGDGDDD